MNNKLPIFLIAYPYANLELNECFNVMCRNERDYDRIVLLSRHITRDDLIYKVKSLIKDNTERRTILVVSSSKDYVALPELCCIEANSNANVVRRLLTIPTQQEIQFTLTCKANTPYAKALANKVHSFASSPSGWKLGGSQRSLSSNVININFSQKSTTELDNDESENLVEKSAVGFSSSDKEQQVNTRTLSSKLKDLRITIYYVDSYYTFIAETKDVTLANESVDLTVTLKDDSTHKIKIELQPDGQGLSGQCDFYCEDPLIHINPDSNTYDWTIVSG